MTARRTIALVVAASPLAVGCESPTGPTASEWVVSSILDSTHLHCVAFGRGVWVVVAQQGKLATSSDLRNWTVRSTHWTQTDDILNVYFANGVFVALGTDRSGNSQYVAVSPDGATWTPRSVSVELNHLGPVYFSYRLNLWFAAGMRESGSVIFSSADLVTWTPHDPGFGADAIISITEGNGMLMISGGSEKIGASEDGASWSVRQLEHTAEGINDIDKVRFFSGAFLAIMHPDASTVYRSTDGEVWTALPTGWPPRDPSCVVWDCPDGPGGWVSIAQRNDGLIVATGVHGKMMLSRDLGASWLKVSSPVTTHLNTVESDGRRFVAVGNDGTVLVSGEVISAR